ncbi:hypothetical protein [Paenibacillus planticolens]|uniref:Uncharacterized protein n=1 Tax=Paenibacillus planticolens TaxID=2654976 RepID=A0ABX1ZTN2_9BACL|nr:hypothetical protein [Paenibacillus planticolens]NOV02287.1 hypothetical protein [Paenibacillus planticolens]
MTTLSELLGGLSCIISGVLLFLAHLLNLGASNGIGTTLGQTLVLSAHLLLVFAFFWLYSAYRSQIGFLGLLGMISSIIGTILVTAIVFVEVASVSGKQVGAVFETSVTRNLQTFGPLLFVLGMILFGLSFLRGRGVPRGGGLLLIVGTLVFASGSLVVEAEALISTIGAGLTGAGFVWLGMTTNRLTHV